MVGGAAQSYDRLAALLASMPARGVSQDGA